jgi:hypothetical protein
MNSIRRPLMFLFLAAAFAYGCGDDSEPTAPVETPEAQEAVGRWVGENLTVVVTKDGRWTSDGYLIGEANCGGSTGEFRVRMQLEGVVVLGPPAAMAATTTTGTITELTKSISATWAADWTVLRGTASGHSRAPTGCSGDVTHEFALVRTGE